MTFSATGLKPLGGAGLEFNEGKVMAYVSEDDDLATILASGYFDDIADKLDTNYLMVIRGTDGQTLGLLTRDSGGTVLSASTGMSPINAGAALTLAVATHNNRTIYLDQASGSAITLPAATGSGAKFRIVVSTTVTSNNHTISAAGTDEFHGHCIQTDTDTSDTLASYPALAADNFDTITMNGTTKGGLSGDVWELEDIASGVWAVKGLINANGSVATPFSAS